MADVKPGEATTEYAAQKSGSLWGIIATVLGILITIGSVVAAGFGESTTGGIVAGAVVSLAGIIQKSLTDLGYIKSRADVKAAASTETSTAGAIPAGASGNDLPELGD